MQVQAALPVTAKQGDLLIEYSDETVTLKWIVPIVHAVILKAVTQLQHIFLAAVSTEKSGFSSRMVSLIQ